MTSNKKQEIHKKLIGSEAPSIIRAPRRSPQLLSLKGRKWWIHVSEGIETKLPTRVELAKASYIQSQTILASPLSRILGSPLKRTIMAKSLAFMNFLNKRFTKYYKPVRPFDVNTIHDWLPKRVGAHVYIDGIKVTEHTDLDSIGKRRIVISATGLLPLNIYFLNPQLPKNLDAADAVTFSLGKGAKIAAMAFRISVEQYPMHHLASQRFIIDAAWERVKRGGDGTGVDRISAHLIKNPNKFIEIAAYRMFSDHVSPKPLKQVYVPKADPNKWRPLAIPTLRDRLIQSAMLEVLSPLYEERFLDFSFGFRWGRTSRDAIHLLRKYLDGGYRWCILLDLKDYFETIPWSKLKQFLREDIPDQKLVRWIMQQIAAPTKPAKLPKTGDISNLVPPPADGSLLTRTQGVPQGAPISPLLANLFLHRFDQWISQNRYRAVRYADDITLLAKRKSDAIRLLENSAYYLESHLGLTVNREKTKIVNAGAGEPLAVLGFELIKGRLSPSEKNMNKCKELLIAILRIPRHPQMRLQFFMQASAGWRNFFEQAGNRTMLRELEEWTTKVIQSFGTYVKSLQAKNFTHQSPPDDPK